VLMASQAAVTMFRNVSELLQAATRPATSRPIAVPTTPMGLADSATLSTRWAAAHASVAPLMTACAAANATVRARAKAACAAILPYSSAARPRLATADPAVLAPLAIADPAVLAADPARCAAERMPSHAAVAPLTTTEPAVRAAPAIVCPAVLATPAALDAAVWIPDHTAVAALPAPAAGAAVDTPDQIVRTVSTDLRTPSTAVVISFQPLNAATTASAAVAKLRSVSGDRLASHPVIDLITSSAPAPGPDSPDRRLTR